MLTTRAAVLVAGIDEAGRGPLAGPVVAAAVVLDPARPIVGLRDSKLLSARQRACLAVEIRARALAWSVGEAWIDGNRCPQLACAVRAIVKGDRDVAVISAASILAKTVRDAMLDDLDGRYPAYGFAHNRGYGTPGHLAALARHGPCPAHRRSFAPVAQSAFDF